MNYKIKPPVGKTVFKFKNENNLYYIENIVYSGSCYIVYVDMTTGEIKDGKYNSIYYKIIVVNLED